MKTEELFIDSNDLSEGEISLREVMCGEIEEAKIENIGIKGPCQYTTATSLDWYEVLIVFSGEMTIEAGGIKRKIGSSSIVRIPYGKDYTIEVKDGRWMNYLRIMKILDEADKEIIAGNQAIHSDFYAKALEECPMYTEDIKSSKSENRMILSEGMVPRLCMGTVKTVGPDQVDKHKHPMLDQLFLGLEGCKCTCYADGQEAELTANRLLHIPLGSRHSVCVKKDHTLYYIWLDFFLTLEGEEYMGKQHRVEPE